MQKIVSLSLLIKSIVKAVGFFLFLTMLKVLLLSKNRNKNIISDLLRYWFSLYQLASNGIYNPLSLK
jgi:hypothetical protein